MDGKNNKTKNKWLHIRLDEDEYKLLTDNFSRTTEKKLSRYARKIFLAKPVTVIHRDGSLDELIAVLVKVQNDLNGIANNYNQMVHRLHISDTDMQVKAWITEYEKQRETLFDTIENTKQIISEGAKLWLQ